MVKPLSIFVSYAHKDRIFLEELMKFLQSYVSKKIISIWTDREILAGEKWDEQIKSHLKAADMMLLLVSVDSINSIYINETEIESAFVNDKVVVIPVIIRPVVMSQLGPLNNYQILPPEAKPVEIWDIRDEAWKEVTTALERVINKLNGKQADRSGNENIARVQGNDNMVLNRVNVTNKIMVGILFLLLFFSFVALGIGLFTRDGMFVCSGFTGLGIGLFSYFFSRRNLSV